MKLDFSRKDHTMNQGIDYKGWRSESGLFELLVRSTIHMKSPRVGSRSRSGCAPRYFGREGRKPHGGMGEQDAREHGTANFRQSEGEKQLKA